MIEQHIDILGAEHGFAFPRRKGIYNQPTAEWHWEWRRLSEKH